MINYTKLQTIFSNSIQDYHQATPFPHIAIDEFISKESVREILENFPVVKENSSSHQDYGRHSGKPTQIKKRWVAMELKVKPVIRKLYAELRSADFISLLETLTGISPLLPDPHMLGGGIHETLPGGYLKVHADFNVHPNFYLYRRLNLLIYLNQDWQAEWGGNLELWDNTGTHQVKSISPIAGRAVIFSTSSHSFHGHPHPLGCPAGNSRKSIALYYFSPQQPEGSREKMHMTLWKNS
ncbi:MAG: 2OG-Fe(II) oxygenase [Gammaproteobacteria bacterium]|nr:MAG: 2OG-Fe(II) oxygenase [Gammaproteobacteria bacterium]